MQQQIITTLTIEDLTSLIEDSITNTITKLMPEQKENSAEESALMTTKEVAEYLRVSAVTIWHWKKQGRISYHKIGRRVYFKKEEIINMMAYNRRS